MLFAAFFAEEKPFPENGTVFKIVASGAAIGAPMREEIVET